MPGIRFQTGGGGNKVLQYISLCPTRKLSAAVRSLLLQSPLAQNSYESSSESFISPRLTCRWERVSRGKLERWIHCVPKTSGEGWGVLEETAEPRVC